LVRQKDAILATGHISAKEHHAVARELATLGKVLVTHAGEAILGPRLSPAQCLELADLGATIELTALTCQGVLGAKGKSPAEMLAMISAVGPSRCVLSTDYGWSRDIPKPAAGLADFLEMLWREGVSESDLTAMASQNPARLLALDV
jgi:predicted metal-dependent phosphotriesterase family hydrolase